MTFERGGIPWNKGLHILGHPNPNKGKHIIHSGSFKKGHPGYPNAGSFKKGHRLSSEEKQKRKLAMSEYTVSKQTRDKISKAITGRILSGSSKKKISASRQGQRPWNSGLTKETDPRVLKYSATLINSPKAIEARSQIKYPKKNTLPEIILQRALTELKITFTTQKKIFGIPDIFIDPNICIFLDGCYWHSCPVHHPKNKYFWRREYDEKVTKILEREGNVVFRFWEHEIVNMR